GHSREASAQDVVHDAARHELRLRADRDAWRARGPGRGGLSRRPPVERGVRGAGGASARALRSAVGSQPQRSACRAAGARGGAAPNPRGVDVGRVRRMRETVGPDVALRVDANQGWDRPTALDAVHALEPYHLDFVEQPVPRWDLDGMAEIARRSRIPIMADESCASEHDAFTIAQRGGVSILALKLTKSAGILGTMAIARIAQAAGLGCYVGCMIETSLGTAAYLHVALAAAPVTGGCERFRPVLLQGDVVRRPAQYADGAILALDGPGLGVDVDE